MSRTMVATAFVWSHYPGLRAGRVYAGKSDITRHPTGETHVVEGDAAETLCGQPRAGFPHEFTEDTTPGQRVQFCPTCRPSS